MKTNEIAKILAELGNETRLEIFRLLVKVGMPGISIGEIGKRMSLPASTLAFHLKGLMAAELITQEKSGRTVMCCANLSTLTYVIHVLATECCIEQKELVND
ncbi:hypothetical protein A9Q83_01045 [Alphaproteobacteria bacterium 46_93_T64]|nr:hypothetical protein A9Q83_01045 [Alphaproteobacteria bacterium 46_93_T64]